MHSSGTHLSKEMLDLIKSIGDSRSKQEEDKIILKESEILKKKIKESGTTPKKMKEYLLRAIYIEMLGHEATFAHLFSVNLTQDKNYLNKRVGYLACSLLLNEESEFLILLVASLQKDIQSSNWVEVCMALTTVIKFANPTIMQALTEPILKLLDHKSEQIRKKAVMCLYKFYQVDKNSVPDCDERMRRLLCDFDPSVMAATLPYFKEQAMKDPDKYKDLVTPLIVILKQVIEHKLPRDYDYHRFPAPWIQVIILEILSILGRDDQSYSENMYEIIGQCLRRADDTGINIGYAIVYQCLKTICTIYPNPHLIELASNTISRFLSSDSPNLRCTGINGLTLIIQINPNYVMTHQQVIVDCLEENDETLKKNTFELLYKMTNLKNVEVIVDKMMNYLKHTTLESVSKKDILTKITELTERFAPSKSWFIKVMNELFVNFGEMITDDILSKLIKIINEWERETDDIEEFKKFTIENYATIVENYAALPDSLVKLLAWVTGEYTNKLYFNDQNKIKQILEMLTYLLNKAYDDDMTKCLLISAIAKIHSNLNFIPLDYLNEVIEKYSRDKNPEIQQRCLEYKRIQSKNAIIEKNQFTTINDEFELDTSLPFLNSFVQQRANGKFYDENKSDRLYERFNSDSVQLNVGPYDTPDTVTSMPSKGGNFNTLYESRGNNLSTNTRNELKVTGAQKWGAEGYKDEKPIQPEKPKFLNTSSVGNTNVSNVGQVISSSKNSPYVSVSGGSSSKNNYSSSNTYVPKKQEEKYDPNSKEKKKLMGQLFGGLTVDSSGNTNSNNNNLFESKNNNNNSSGGLFSGMNVTGGNTSNLQSGNQGDLLGLGNNDNQPVQQQQTNSLDLLSDIFGGGSTTTTSNTNTNNNMNLFGGLTQNNPNTNVTSNPSNNDIFASLSGGTSSNTFNISSQSQYTPYQINTDQFGEMWESFAEEDSYDLNINIASPQAFHEIIKSKGNFAAVEIINNEAISSATYKGQPALVYATIEPNHLGLLVKCKNKSLNQEVGKYIMSLFQ
jgi:AP-4 complex subunit epsilon-1